MADESTILLLLEAQDRASAKLVALQGQIEKLRLSSSEGGAALAAHGAGAGAGAAGLDKLAGAGKRVGEGLVGAAAGSVYLAETYGKQVGALAATADISVAQANKIGAAFLTTAGQTTFSAREIVTAYSPVAGQLGEVAGHALNASEALGFMRQATALAEATGQELGGTTEGLVQVMQAYHVGVNGAAGASNVMFNASRLTHLSVADLATGMDRLHARLGDAAPSLSQTGALLVEMSQHGIQGNRALMQVSTAMTHLMDDANKAGPAAAKAIEKAQKQADSTGTALERAQRRYSDLLAVDAAKSQMTATQKDELTAAQDRVTQALTNYGAGSDQAAAAQTHLQDVEDRLAQSHALSESQVLALQNARQQVTDAAAKHSTAEANLQAALKASGTAAASLGIQVYDAHGKFVGMDSIIRQLQPKLAGMDDAQRRAAITTLFGAGAANTMLQVIEDGPAKFDALTKSVSRSGSAHEAAEKRAHTFEGELKTAKSTAVDLGIRIGDALIPKLTDVLHWTEEGVVWFEHHKAAAIALASAVSGVLGVALAAFVYKTAVDFISNVGKMAQGVGTLVTKITGIGGGAKGLDTAGKTAAGALDDASTTLGEAATRLSTAAEALTAAAEKLAGAGGTAATEMEAAGATVSTEIDAAGATAATELDAAGATVEAELAAGGATAATEMEAGGMAAGKAGAAGMLAASAIVGYQIGTAINEKFHISDKLDNLIVGPPPTGPNMAVVPASQKQSKYPNVIFGQGGWTDEKSGKHAAWTDEAAGVAEFGQADYNLLRLNYTMGSSAYLLGNTGPAPTMSGTNARLNMDAGGILPPGLSVVANMTGGPEVVSPTRNPNAARSMMAHLGTDSAAGGVQVGPNYFLSEPQSEQEIAHELAWLLKKV